MNDAGFLKPVCLLYLVALACNIYSPIVRTHNQLFIKLLFNVLSRFPLAGSNLVAYHVAVHEVTKSTQRVHSQSPGLSWPSDKNVLHNLHVGNVHILALRANCAGSFSRHKSAPEAAAAAAHVKQRTVWCDKRTPFVKNRS